MELIKSKKANSNYLAKIVQIDTFHKHPDPEVAKLKCATVDGWNIIVGIDEQPGKFVYFPTSSQINPDFLSYANLYRHKEKNADETKTGMFEDNGRVKAIKLRGCVSEGFLIPINIFLDWIADSTLIQLEANDITTDIEFDSVEHKGKTFWVCKKYIVVHQHSISNKDGKNRNQKHISKFDRIIDTQFRFHYDTELIRRFKNAIKPEDLIHISGKIHGTSGISAYVLCQKPINLIKRFGNWISGKGFKPYEEVYDYVYASRSVIKNRYYNREVSAGYYGVDVWGEADKYLRPYLQKGMTFYYEIVGFLPNGNYIQKNYDYGCVPPKEGEIYTPEKHFKVRIYRITLTNVDGQVHEFNPNEVQIWCNEHGLIPVEEYYYGFAADLYKDLYQVCQGERLYPNDWYDQFLESMANDEDFYMEEMSPDCNNKVPHEGIVIKIDNMHSAAYKLKCFAFLNKEQKELDAGEENIEDEN